jgi:hypothetical protein
MIMASKSVFHDFLPFGAIVYKNIYGTKISSLLQVLSVGREYNDKMRSRSPFFPFPFIQF